MHARLNNNNNNVLQTLQKKKEIFERGFGAKSTKYGVECVSANFRIDANFHYHHQHQQH